MHAMKLIPSNLQDVRCWECRGMVIYGI